MKPWILCVNETPNDEDVFNNKIVFYDLKYRCVYMNERPAFLTDSDACYLHLGWMKVENFIENCSEFPLSDKL